MTFKLQSQDTTYNVNHEAILRNATVYVRATGIMKSGEIS